MNARQPTITAYTLVNALGAGRSAAAAALWHGRTGLAPAHEFGFELDTHVGAVPDLDAVRMPARLASHDCRNNRLALRALQEDGFTAAVGRALARHGPSRVGLFLGTSTSGIAATEEAYARRGDDDRLPPFDFHGTHNLASLSELVASVLSLEGPALVVSTACSSSAKVYGMARRYLELGLCDAAVVGGVDSLCLTTLHGFNALQLLSSRPCSPWAHGRDGISIGEAAGFALIEQGGAGVRMLGCGESADAYHMSSPSPGGEGAVQALRAALVPARLDGAALDYVNLHGTGTPANDASEDRAVTAVVGLHAPCSSTKRLTGHTLGAAGVTEVLFSCIALEEGMVPGGPTEEPLDAALGARYVTRSFPQPLGHAASLSLGFGGSNCCVLLGGPA